MPNIIFFLLSIVLSFANISLSEHQLVCNEQLTVTDIESNYTFFNTGGAVVWTDPAFPTQTDFVKVYFNAKQGNGALEGYTGDVYAHTGLITSNSSGPTDWQHVQGNWGTADANVLMTSEGNDIYSIEYDIESFYGVSQDEVVLELAFVFRNVDGSIVGRDTDGSDIFTPIYEDSQQLIANLSSPEEFGEIVYVGESVKVILETNIEANILIEDNGQVVFDDFVSSVDFDLEAMELGAHVLDFTISDGVNEILLQREFFVLDQNEVLMDPPAGVKNGLNYRENDKLLFQLYAPQKEHVFLLCPENQFRIDIDFKLNKGTDEATFWIELDKALFENDQNLYQYLVDGSIRIADPFSTIILDPWSDDEIRSEVLDQWPDYPEDQTVDIVTAFETEESDFDWQINDFVAPNKEDLVIYEVLMRDFLDDHSYVSLKDTLDYFEKLGVNAIQLMPVNEFENNDSWGYNPSFHMALDKYYGSPDEFKAFIDEAHKRGIAIIVDVVYNHVFSQSPLAKLYWDAGNFKPTPDNPWLNVEAKHPFNVGYDVNHESEASNEWVKQVLSYWIEEYRLDGFRFDLSKGFTQTNSGNDVGFWSLYDQSRVNILKDYVDHIWSHDPNIYAIMEHFAANPEERVLSNHGMMLWGNGNYDFNEATMGYDFYVSWSSYQERDWDDPNLISYMESHDEERLMFKNLEYGNSDGSYNVKDGTTALLRVEAATALFYSIPGPKMLWQFGELGYEFSINRCTDGTINENCRLSRKPILWEYTTDVRRARLRDVTQAAIHLKTNYPSFRTTDFTITDNHPHHKLVHLNHPEMDVVYIGNFDVIPAQIDPNFQNTGNWYEYFSGDSLIVNNVNESINLMPGEYRIFTSENINPPIDLFTSTEDFQIVNELEAYPNPISSNGILHLNYGELNFDGEVRFFNSNGQMNLIKSIQNGNVKLENELSNGLYFVQYQNGSTIYWTKIMVQ